MSITTLNDELAIQLKHLHETRGVNGLEPLYAFVASLHAAGWPMAAVSSALGVSRETPRVWCRRAAELDLPLVTVPQHVPAASLEAVRLENVRIRRETRDAREAAVLGALLPRLLELQPLAEALRGPSWASPENAAASAEYTALIDEALKSGVRAQVLADALDVALITVYARLRRSGLRKTAPTEKIPMWAKTSDWQNTVQTMSA